jgi:integrase
VAATGTESDRSPAGGSPVVAAYGLRFAQGAKRPIPAAKEPRFARARDLVSLKCKAVVEPAGLDSGKFDLKTFRSTDSTRVLRSGFDVRTVQHWMGHKSLETTMRYLLPARDVHDRLDRVVVPTVPKDADPPEEVRSAGSRS